MKFGVVKLLVLYYQEMNQTTTVPSLTIASWMVLGRLPYHRRTRFGGILVQQDVGIIVGQLPGLLLDNTHISYFTKKLAYCCPVINWILIWTPVPVFV
jgi:hypothetical protein